MMHPGHSTPADAQRLDRLRSKIEGGGYDETDYLDFALLHFEPFHQEDEAIRLLASYVDDEPESWRARVWLAYLYQHHRMDSGSLREAQDLLAPLLDRQGAPRAAALMLSSSIGRDLQELDLAGQAELLERAIEEEPDWATHRYYLAEVYAELGRREAALRALNEARQRSLTVATSASGEEHEFEVLITGRASEGLPSLLDEAQRSLQQVL